MHTISQIQPKISRSSQSQRQGGIPITNNHRFSQRLEVESLQHGVCEPMLAQSSPVPNPHFVEDVDIDHEPRPSIANVDGGKISPGNEVYLLFFVCIYATINGYMLSHTVLVRFL